jgi:DnaJ-class molecular chaperone
MNGKGDTPRPYDKKKWDQEYERIFSKEASCTHCSGSGFIGSELNIMRCGECGGSGRAHRVTNPPRNDSSGVSSSAPKTYE